MVRQDKLPVPRFGLLVLSSSGEIFNFIINNYPLRSDYYERLCRLFAPRAYAMLSTAAVLSATFQYDFKFAGGTWGGVVLLVLEGYFCAP